MAKRHKKKARPARRWYSSRRLQLALTGALVITVAVVAFYAFTGGDDAPRVPLRQEPVVTGAMEVSVDVVDRDYIPRELTVPRGATVTWRFKGDEAHDVTDDRGAFGSPILDTGDEWSLAFETPGTYYYYCTLHHGMLGTLTVAE